MNARRLFCPPSSLVGTTFTSWGSSVVLFPMVGDEENHNDKDCNDNKKWEPGILRTHPRAQRNKNDGHVGRDGDEHCANRLSFYLKLHSREGTRVPPKKKLINMLERLR